MVLYAAARPDRLADALVILSDAASYTASGGMEVGAVAVIKDLGASQAFLDFVVDISNVTAPTNDELYIVSVQGSNSSTFASGIVNLGSFVIGDPLVSGADIAMTTHVGSRQVVPFANLYQGTVYRYLRGYILMTGTDPAINLTRAFVSPRF